MWIQIWNEQRGRIIGSVGGLFLAIVYLISGFWDMLIVAFIVYIGYSIGKKIDQHEALFDIDAWFKWLGERWRLFR
jgi:uncharacterized membrane protein